QGYLQDDLGNPKVNATGDLCSQINHQVEIHTTRGRFQRSEKTGDVLFCCVDSIETRALIWKAVRDNGHVRFFADARMSAEVVRVLVASDAASRSHYPTTLFAANQAYT